MKCQCLASERVLTRSMMAYHVQKRAKGQTNNQDKGSSCTAEPERLRQKFPARHSAVGCVFQVAYRFVHSASSTHAFSISWLAATESNSACSRSHQLLFCHGLPCLCCTAVQCCPPADQLQGTDQT